MASKMRMDPSTVDPPAEIALVEARTESSSTDALARRYHAESGLPGLDLFPAHRPSADGAPQLAKAPRVLF
jgi:hypothetical protein